MTRTYCQAPERAVNRNNRPSIAWYTGMGFKTVASIVQDMGLGFVMDDYRMEKTIDQESPADDIPKAASGEWRCFPERAPRIGA